MKNEPHLSQLTNLNTLSFCLEGSLTHNDREDIPEVLEAIGASVRTLRSLSVCGWALWRSPIHTLRDLTHLEIFGTQSVANLSLLFHHNVRLESFSLGYRNNSELSEVLREHPDALPHLHSFKLITEWDYMEMDHMENLKAFLLTKPRLRRFDIQAAMPWYGSSPIVEVLRALPSLEVLGLELQSTRHVALYFVTSRNTGSWLLLWRRRRRILGFLFFSLYSSFLVGLENITWDPIAKFRVLRAGSFG